MVGVWPNSQKFTLWESREGHGASIPAAGADWGGGGGISPRAAHVDSLTPTPPRTLSCLNQDPYLHFRITSSGLQPVLSEQRKEKGSKLVSGETFPLTQRSHPGQRLARQVYPPIWFQEYKFSWPQTPRSAFLRPVMFPHGQSFHSPNGNVSSPRRENSDLFTLTYKQAILFLSQSRFGDWKRYRSRRQWDHQGPWSSLHMKVLDIHWKKSKSHY